MAHSSVQHQTIQLQTMLILLIHFQVHFDLNYASFCRKESDPHGTGINTCLLSLLLKAPKLFI